MDGANSPKAVARRQQSQRRIARQHQYRGLSQIVHCPRSLSVEAGSSWGLPLSMRSCRPWGYSTTMQPDVRSGQKLNALGNSSRSLNCGVIVVLGKCRLSAISGSGAAKYTFPLSLSGLRPSIGRAHLIIPYRKTLTRICSLEKAFSCAS